MLRLTRRGLETERWDGLRHRQGAKVAGNSYSPSLWPPRLPSTLPEEGRWKSTHCGNLLATYPTSCAVLKQR